MNVIWIVADTFRRDHLRAYGNSAIRTPSLDALAASAVRFDNHYSAGSTRISTRWPGGHSADGTEYRACRHWT